MEKLKSFFSNIKNKMTKKKAIALVAIVLAVCVGAGIFLHRGVQAAGGNNAFMANGVRTTVLQSTTLADSVTVTGTVESTETVNVTSTVTGTTISEILVQAGDSVTEGQTLIKLDTGDILERIEEEKERLAENAEKAQTAYTKAEDAQAAAYNTSIAAEEVLKTAKSDLSTATTNFNAAKNAVALQQSEYDTAYAEYTTALNNHNNAVAAMNTALAAKDTAFAKYSATKSAYEQADQTAENYTELESAYNTAKAEYETAAAAYDKAAAAAGYTAEKDSEGNYTGTTAEAGAGTLQKYRDAETIYKTADENLRTAKNNSQYDTLEKAYNEAVSAKDRARTSLDNAEAAYEKAIDAFETAKDNLENSSTSDTLEQLYEDYNECIIKAAVSGTVTQVNATVGSAANGTLMTIEDTANLKISTSFRESDVQNIEIGMRCVITSDANDKELTGYVTQISPVAASGGMGSSSDVSFSGEITISGTDHGLLIGMNAKAEVILSQVSNVFVVPYDAVGTDENGEKVVYVQNGEDFTPVVVTTGMETDYYIEISSDELSAGMVIRSSANRDESDSMVFTEDGEEAEEDQFGFAMPVMTGGTMPSGGMGGNGGNGGRPSGGGDMPGGGGMGGRG